jgi:hypothetical protein
LGEEELEGGTRNERALELVGPDGVEKVEVEDDGEAMAVAPACPEEEGEVRVVALEVLRCARAGAGAGAAAGEVEEGEDTDEEEEGGAAVLSWRLGFGWVVEGTAADEVEKEEENDIDAEGAGTGAEVTGAAGAGDCCFRAGGGALPTGGAASREAATREA